jgi:hypothetical protein
MVGDRGQVTGKEDRDRKSRRRSHTKGEKEAETNARASVTGRP